MNNNKNTNGRIVSYNHGTNNNERPMQENNMTFPTINCDNLDNASISIDIGDEDSDFVAKLFEMENGSCHNGQHSVYVTDFIPQLRDDNASDVNLTVVDMDIELNYVEDFASVVQRTNTSTPTLRPITPTAPQTEMLLHQCEQCSNRFATKCLLVKHLHNMHPASELSQLYTCKHCDKQFSTIEAQEKHQLECVTQKVKCLKCGLAFNAMEILRIHYNTVHVTFISQLKTLSTKEICATFQQHKQFLSELYNVNISAPKRSYEPQDIPPMIALDIVSHDQFNEMVNLLVANVVRNQHTEHDHLDVIFQLLIPEWTLAMLASLNQCKRSEVLSKLQHKQ